MRNKKVKQKTVSNKCANAYEAHKTKQRHTNTMVKWQKQGQMFYKDL